MHTLKEVRGEPQATALKSLMPSPPYNYHELLKIRFYFKRNIEDRLIFLIQEIKINHFSVLLKK